MSSRPKPKLRTRSIRNGLNLTDQPEPGGSRRPGRRPHVPSSKPTMSKSRRASSPGSIGSGHRLHRLRRGTKRTRDLVKRPRPLAGGAYMGGLPTRQPAFLHLCCKFRMSCSGPFRLPCQAIDKKQPAPIQGTSACNSTTSSSSLKRFGYRRASHRLRLPSGPSGISRGRRSRRCPESRRGRPPANAGFAASSSAPKRRERRSRGRR